MASHESALKAHRQSLKNRERNRQYDGRTRGGWTQGVAWPPGARADRATAPAGDPEPAQPW